MSIHTFDLVISGGRVLDPSTQTDAQLEVGIVGGRIAALTSSALAGQARSVLDARGCLVVPGLIDVHTHLFSGGSYWGIRPGPVAWRSGVTTWVDAGSAGVYNLRSFRECLYSYSPLRTYAFLNVSSIGLVGQTGELALVEHCDPVLCAGAIREHRDILVGVKCRIDHRSTAGGSLGALYSALSASRVAEVPLMVHIGQGPPDLAEIVSVLDMGDIVTHCATGQSMALVDDEGRLRQCVRDAHERGVLFDVGHGSGAFSFAVAEALIREGVAPDIISTDLHQLSVLGPAFDLPTTMSKLLIAGMPLSKVIESTTWAAAKAIRREEQCGVLAVGRAADIAVLRLAPGEVRLFDAHLHERVTPHLLQCDATIVAGRLLPGEPPDKPAPWIALSGAQRVLAENGETTDRRPWALRLQKKEHFVARAIAGPPRFASVPSSPDGDSDGPPRMDLA